MLDALTMKMIRYYRGDADRIQHFTKVHSYARLIAVSEQLEPDMQFITEAAAIVHDIGIRLCEQKYGECGGKLQEIEGPALAEKMLNELMFPSNVVERVSYLVGHHHTYDKIDGTDYQILVEADFLVNFLEGGMDKDAIRTTYEKIFKTGTGRLVCREMFGLDCASAPSSFT